jgi:hypothetical protein
MHKLSRKSTEKWLCKGKLLPTNGFQQPASGLEQLIL